MIMAIFVDTGKRHSRRVGWVIDHHRAAAMDAVMDKEKIMKSLLPIDAGPLANARHIEPLAHVNIQFGHMLGHGTRIAPAWPSR